MYERPAPRPRRMKRISPVCVFSLALFGFGSLAVHGAPPEGSDPPDSANVSIVPRVRREPGIPTPTVRVDSKLVLIPVTVTDQRAQPVLGLHKEAFHVFEDG